MGQISLSMANTLFTGASIFALVLAAASAVCTCILAAYSLGRADKIFRQTTVASMLLAFLGAVTGFILYAASGVREEYADQSLAKINQKTATIQSENLRLQTKLEAERRARLALEGQVAPRRLTTAQKLNFVGTLLKFEGQKVRVISPPNAESTDYALDFLDVFKQAGWWNVEADKPGISFASYDRELQGVHVGQQNGDPLADSARSVLESVLTKQGIRFSVKNDPASNDRSVIEFYVGVKPFVESARQ